MDTVGGEGGGSPPIFDLLDKYFAKKDPPTDLDPLRWCENCAEEYLDDGISQKQCPSCGALIEYNYDIDIKKTKTVTSRIRVSGPNAHEYQTEIDKYNTAADSTEKKTIFLELVRYNEEAVQNGKRSIPLEVLRRVSDEYMAVQRLDVKRANFKKQIIVELIADSSAKVSGVVRSTKELSEWIQLSKHSTARGRDYLTTLSEDVKDTLIDYNGHDNHREAHISTALRYFSVDPNDQGWVRAAVNEILAVADQNSLGINSTIKSKIIAAMYVILWRKKYKGVDKLTTFAQTKSTPENYVPKPNTLKKFVLELGKYHDTFFKSIYAKYGLDTAKK